MLLPAPLVAVQAKDSDGFVAIDFRTEDLCMMLVLDTCLLLADTIHDSSCTEINSELLIHMRNVRVNTSI